MPLNLLLRKAQEIDIHRHFFRWWGFLFEYLLSKRETHIIPQFLKKTYFTSGYETLGAVTT